MVSRCSLELNVNLSWKPPYTAEGILGELLEWLRLKRSITIQENKMVHVYWHPFLSRAAFNDAFGTLELLLAHIKKSEFMINDSLCQCIPVPDHSVAMWLTP